jgi:hypothetical protein
MMKKYGGNFAGKELRLFHGTNVENIEKINADGLNRNYAGIHGNVCLFFLLMLLLLLLLSLSLSLLTCCSCQGRKKHQKIGGGGAPASRGILGH